MRYSNLFGKASKTVAQYESRSHELLVKGGFIDQVASGIFNFLPLGKKVLSKIETIIREEMNNLGAQEVLMPILHPKSLWQKTSRWQTVDVLFKTKSRYGQEYALAPTHEETITPLAKKFIKSYKDLPQALYHITAKFRDEPRPKSGILRGKEFLMKDLYSFHINQENLLLFYQKVIQSYLKIFSRCGLDNIKITEASGGSFTKKYSHEFNVLTKAGEVNLIYCSTCNFAQNEEIINLTNRKKCPNCKTDLLSGKAIEVGNIFNLETKFSDAFDLRFIDKDGLEKKVWMGCYGIGISRLMGAVVEVKNDEKGIIWPTSIAPYQIHLIGLDLADSAVKNFSYNIYQKLVKKYANQVLFDDRENVSNGEKLLDSDLIGIPWRLVISKKTKEKIEIKKRSDKTVRLISFSQLDQLLQSLKI